MLLGCIGDDFTGSSDLANTLAKEGMRTVQYNGIPSSLADPRIEAGVVALKTRTVPISDAVAQSLAALQWLKAQGCQQFLFKYCSTFDSTPQGNIGPVLDALSDALGANQVIVCPAFPTVGRSIYQGHLFVHDRLLSESGMERHPLTPMTDPDLRRWLGQQTSHKVGHVPYQAVAGGSSIIRSVLDAVGARQERYVVIDAVRDIDLRAIGAAVAGDTLLSGGSGIAIGLPENFRISGQIGTTSMDWLGEAGPAAALCGSCSETSRRQIADHAALFPSLEVSAGAILSGTAMPSKYAEWIISNQQPDAPPLVYSSTKPSAVRQAQLQYGKQQVSRAVEDFFAELARELIGRGVRRLIVAGGETSGAVVSALSIPAFVIGPEIDPGVPALRAVDSGTVLALKSGNFGAPDFFEKAAAALSGRGNC